MVVVIIYLFINYCDYFVGSVIWKLKYFYKVVIVDLKIKHLFCYIYLTIISEVVVVVVVIIY